MSEFEFPFDFGGGLDRHTGIASAQPSRMRDLRNVYLYAGKVQARRGYTRADDRGLVLTNGTVCDSVIALHEVRQEFSAIAVGFVESTREVHVFRVSDTGASAEHLGLWFVASGSGTPRVLAAEMYGKVFLAHDEAKVRRRATTIYYDSSATPVLVALRANLARLDPAPDPLPAVKFRGVCAHSGYLWGWGYGTSEDENHPETIRNSKPGEPTVFEPDSSGNFGSGGDPILCCGSVAGGLIVQKQTETHLLQGYSDETFSPRLIDARYGVAGSRAGLHVGGSWFTWTAEGPRVTSGGPLDDLAIPLDLGGPGVAGLAAEGALTDGFALYVPERRLLQWYFGRRVYSLSLHDPSSPAWSYAEIPAEAQCGAVFAIPAADAPTIGPRALAATEIAATTATLNWSNDADSDGDADNDSDEMLEVWLRAGGGAWRDDIHNTLAVGTNQSYAATGLASETAHDVAYRYRRGTRLGVGYESADPMLWPAESRTSFTTERDSSAVVATWARTDATTEAVTLTWTNIQATKRVLRKLTAASDSEFVEMATGLGAAVLEYVDASIAGETAYTYRVEFTETSTIAVDVDRWSGPDAPTGVVQSSRFNRSAAYDYTIEWTSPALAGTAVAEIGDTWYCPSTFEYRGDTAADAGVHQETYHAGSATILYPMNPAEISFSAGIGHKVTHASGAIDYSEIVKTFIVVTAEDGANDGYGTRCPPPGGGWQQGGVAVTEPA